MNGYERIRAALEGRQADCIPERSLASLDDLVKLPRVDIRKYKYVQIRLEAVSLLKNHFKNYIYIRANCNQVPFFSVTKRQ
ncbi:MAG TPA: hypothetical protein DHW42_01335 [Candidatus Marinimicrobia bacterium]|nr:hypothetical protein [Candidatus Neomarinimicrobiota bacterium]